MTMQMPIVPKAVMQDGDLSALMAPPRAPLAMPKQVLTSDQGPMRRASGAVVALIAQLWPGLRRTG